jgi:hypothetical protein
VAGKNAYVRPLIVCVVNETLLPPRVSVASVPEDDWTGSMPWRPVAPAPTETMKLRALPFHANDWKRDALRPSTQSSACFAEMTGTERLSADETTASDSGEAAKSVWMLAVKIP